MAALVVLALPLHASAQELRLGNEFQVNAFTTDDQLLPSLAASADGDFVVVWISYTQDGPNSGVFGRRFSSAGARLADEFRVNTSTANDKNRPSVGMDADGDFVVAWNSYTQDGSEYGIFGRRFSSAGAALASEFQVNTYTEDYQYHPLVAALGGGGFVVAWISDVQDGSDSGVFARRFSSAGAALASEFQVNTYTTNLQYRASLASDADGDFVVAWTSVLQDGSNAGVFARRFSSAGVPMTNELQVNTHTANNQRVPSVAADADGDFVVAWQSYLQDGSSEGVFARRFSSAGAPLVNELQVNIYTGSVQREPSVAADADGDFIIAWRSLNQDGSIDGVFARRFSSAGAALASEFQVSAYTTNNQARPSVTANGDGHFVIAWDSLAQDGSDNGVFAQRFATPRTLDIDGNGSVDPLTDGLLLLRYLFGFRGVTLTTGAVDLAGCTRCNAASIETQVAGIVLAQPLAEDVRLGGELQVNGFTANNQTLPSVAVAAKGDFVVAWSSVYQDGENTGVFARRFSMAGAPLATEFQVNSSTVSFQDGPSVAADGGGRFVVAWNSFYQDYSSFGVFARRFSSAGVPVASEFQVNSYTSFSQFVPSVAVSASGDFVVAWESGQDGSNNGVFARFLSTSGATLGSEFQVNTYTTGSQRYPSMAADADGDFVVVWESGQDVSGTGIFARRFSSAGTALATELQVNAYTTSGQDRASVAAGASGDFLVAWQSFGQDGSSHGVFARRFSSAGAPLASEFQINTTTTNIQRGASVAADAGGRFVVAWQDSARDGAGFGVFARRVSSAGAPVAGEFQVNTSTAGDQLDPSVAADGKGHLVIAWQDSVRDGSGYGVFAQRFVTATIAMDIDGDGAAEPLIDGLLILRYLFGFRGATLVTGAVGGGCTRCDAPAIEGYIAGLAG